MNNDYTVLGIETSCDECAAAVVRNGKEILSNVVASQIDEHKLYDGVVPEIAARLHSEWIQNVVDQAVLESGMALKDISAIAVTHKPGMIGALLVGLSFAKGLAWSLNKPLIAVDHILAHLYAPQLQWEIPYPYLGLLVSGGHTMVSLMRSYNDIEVLGATIDDACGEAFDKVAKHYGLGYPGGAVIDKLARTGDSLSFRFPQPVLKNSRRSLDMSFSGLKTAAIWQKGQFLKSGKEDNLENLLASYQKAIIDMLLDRLSRAVAMTGIDNILIGGGVAANSYLRQHLAQMDWNIFAPELAFCTDNAAMIAGIAYHYHLSQNYADFDCPAFSRVGDFRSVPQKAK